jgi:RHH-type proline utilization regulon transcriptional repressor/proline dehydrogenase/delta 1-pyrroline-5-carboxylate dehydrogenase
VLIGDGRVGAALTALPHISGVAFTGSSAAAKHIQRALAAQEGPVKSLIAETGGLNAMIIDSTALLEQACQDVIASSFNSGGQRCSALRLAFVQEDVADAFLTLLVGAMQELRLGDPTRRDTDIGPLISQDAAQAVNLHVEKLKKQARFIGSAPAPQDTRGWFVAPTCFELSDARVLEAEVFGPVLHVVRFKASELDQVVDHINGTGYGLTLGVHSRINATIERVAARARVGNLYVNRNMIGAVVGSQPFGGEGLSGTGPKAGGQHYLARFGVERTISIDTTAIGGNASLLCATEADL